MLNYATEIYLKMRRNSTAAPTGVFAELWMAAEERSSLTPEEIATIVDTDEMLVEPATPSSVGSEDNGSSSNGARRNGGGTLASGLLLVISGSTTI
ncbi:hypothetical protein [Halomicrococcus sp. SG-WS-1]|uniref:hypothetical protein n=1 Tax=Halomicrococcus sp. SG-WS-1 TaxID=3439057 RepID=UPI003F799921